MHHLKFVSMKILLETKKYIKKILLNSSTYTT